METPLEWIFATADYQAIPVVLSQTTWQAKAGNGAPGMHPEIREYLEDIRMTIEAPDMVFQSSRDARARVFYKLAVGRGNLQGKHLVVVVKYVDEAPGLRGYVGTMYLSRSIYARGVQVWPKTENSPQ
jgi:hypothetical protein